MAEKTAANTEFVSRWLASAAAERANYQLFLSELCDFLGLPRPQPTVSDDDRNTYVFERSVQFRNVDGSTSVGFIDLYKQGCFVLEAKQGSNQQAPVPGRLFPSSRTRRGSAIRGTHGWDEAMLAARGQAEQYAKALPVSEGWPPFLIVLDVGYSFELYADFSLTGKAYLPFPDARSYRVNFSDLQLPEFRARLQSIWLDPLALDPSRHTEEVTREVAARLALLAKNLELQFEPERVAGFLMRCIFTSFAEDVRLLPQSGWTNLLRSLRDDTSKFPVMVTSLWKSMNEGGFSPILREHLLRFNGGLFESVEALPVNEEQLKLLLEASQADWREVEPAIFGTLLERALDKEERHRLGAHYTPRLFVERLVVPTVVEPLRQDWKASQAAAVALSNSGRTAEAVAEIKRFQQKLCNIRVLDPACGSGNFLYVALEHMKRLEGEVIDTLQSLGESQASLEHMGLTVDPHQLLGIEVNPRAAVITDLVLWIGYLQWHFRTRGDAQPPEPVIRRFHNIEHRDAVLEWNGTELVKDEKGEPVSQWDGVTTRIHSVTGEEVPDQNARRPLLKLLNPHKASWPDADFIVGNPPYVGARYIRSLLGDEYVNALRSAYDEVPKTSDYVMYWWEKAAIAVGSKKARRAGFITTNSIVQPYSRRLIERHLKDKKRGIQIVYAVPDHPWVDSTDGADVRVAMTVMAPKSEIEHARIGRLGNLTGSPAGPNTIVVDDVAVSRISAALTEDRIGQGVSALVANQHLCFQGVVPAGDGFKLEPDELAELGYSESSLPPVIRPYILGRDIVGRRRMKYIIDLFGQTADDALTNWPALYQRLYDRVLPFRSQNHRKAYRDKWWIFAEPRPKMRSCLQGLTRFVVTPYTAKHRPFVFVDSSVLPDAMAYAIGSDDAFVLGTLSSRIHVQWATRGGGRMGVGNDPRYISESVFLTFPFPVCSESQQDTIRDLGEKLDAHRRR